MSEGIILFVLLILWQLLTEYRLRKEVRKYQLKDIAKAIIKLVTLLDNSEGESNS